VKYPESANLAYDASVHNKPNFIHKSLLNCN